MAVMKEFKCKKHGSFEGTHPICPQMGCDSEHVEREFRTPVSVSQGKYQRFDAGLRKTSEMMDIPNWKTARAGEVGFHGRAPIGQEVLWGDDVKNVMGKPFAQMTQEAGASLNVPGKDANDPYVTHNNGLRAVANTTPIFNAPLPKAEITRAAGDKGLKS